MGLFDRIGKSIKEASRLEKGLGAAALLSTVGVTWLLGEPYIDQKGKCKALDKGPSVIFRSVADCEAQGYSGEVCWDSYASAAADLGHRRTIFTGWHFNSQAACEAAYGVCGVHIDSHRFQEYRSDDPAYTPLMAAWQVLEGDPSVSVPLVHTPEQGTLERWDGRKFQVDLERQP